MSGSADPWWRGHFDDAYFRLHDPLFPEEESRREVAVRFFLRKKLIEKQTMKR